MTRVLNTDRLTKSEHEFLVDVCAGKLKCISKQESMELVFNDKTIIGDAKIALLESKGYTLVEIIEAVNIWANS